MKKLLIATVATVALATSAFAGDLPSKKTTPTPPAAPVAAEQAAATQSLDISTGMDYDHNFEKIKNLPKTGITYTYGLPSGFFGAVNVSTNQSYSTNAVDNNFEGRAGYKTSFGAFTLSGQGGIGYHQISTKDSGNNAIGGYPYYALYAAGDYKINDALTLNAVQYRYRNAFDTFYNYESHQLGTGLTYNFTKTQAVYGKYQYNMDQNFNNTSNTVSVGYKVSF